MSGRAEPDAPSRRRAVSLLAAGSWLATLIYTLQSILLVPVFLEYLGSQVYGLWLASGGVIMWLAMLDFGVSALTTQRCGVALGRQDHRLAAQYFSHGAAITALLVILLVGIGIAIGFHVPSIVNATREHHEALRNAFWVATLGAAAALPLELVRGYAAAHQRVAPIVVAGILGDLAAIVVTLIGIWSGLGLMALALGGCVRFLLPAAAGSVHAFSLWKKSAVGNEWSREVFRDYWRIAPSLLGARGSAQLAMGLPPILVTRFVGAEATVVYSVSIRALQVAELLLSQILASGSGAISHFGGQSERPAHAGSLVTYTSVFVAVMVAACAMVAFANSGFVSLWVGAERYAGQWFTVAVIGAGLVAMTSRFLQHVVFNLGGMSVASRLGTAESLLKALGLALLVQHFGSFGVPAATAISSALVLPAVFVVVRRTVSPAEVKRLFDLGAKGWRLVGVVALAAIASPLAVRPSWWEWMVILAATGLLVAVLVFAVLPDLRREVVEFLRNRLKRTGAT
jgi:O-antigen/teichoic acid export membrane protein